MRKTLSLELREKILKAYDRREGTREKIAQKYKVSLGMVKKLLQQRRSTGEVGPRHYRSGRKPQILESHRQQMRSLLARDPSLTLKGLREALGLDCTIQAIHYVLAEMGLTSRKRQAAAQREAKASHGTKRPSPSASNPVRLAKPTPKRNGTAQAPAAARGRRASGAKSAPAATAAAAGQGRSASATRGKRSAAPTAATARRPARKAAPQAARKPAHRKRK